MKRSNHPSAERGASMIETALAAAVVGSVVMAATHALGGSLSQSVNTATRAINPSLFTGPEAEFEGSELSVVTVGLITSSKTPAMVKHPPSGDNKSHSHRNSDRKADGSSVALMGELSRSNQGLSMISCRR
jgi:Flp pilus assembly pilin Flp